MVIYVSEELAASIFRIEENGVFYHEDEGSRFLI
jgi:hypothetical protein